MLCRSGDWDPDGAPPPEIEEELRLRARRLVGSMLSDLASHLGERAPLDLRRAKGWVGEALERALGVTSGSQPEPDFPQLGI
jgi:DNA mismatch repair protein MutH